MLGPTVLAFGLLSLGMLLPNSFGTLAVFMQPELGFDDAQLGQLLAVFWLATSLFAIASGGLADRSGWRRTAATGSAVVLVSLSGLALSRGVIGLAMVMVVGALGYVLCSPTSNLIVVRFVELGRQAFSFGLKQTAPTLITMASGLTIPFLATRYGWRWVLLLGLPALLVPLGFVALWRGSESAVSRAARTRVPILAYGGRRDLAVFVCGNALGTFGMAGASGFGVRSLVDAGVDPRSAGIALAVASCAALAVRVAGGWWLDRMSARSNAALLALVGVGAVGALMMAGPWPSLMIVGLILGVAGAWSWPPLLLMRALQRFPHAPGSVSGHVQVGASIGAASGPLAFGLVAQAASFTAAWCMVAGSAAVAAWLISTGRPQARPTRAPPQ